MKNVITGKIVSLIGDKLKEQKSKEKSGDDINLGNLAKKLAERKQTLSSEQ